MKSPYIEHAASGLPNHTHLEGDKRFVQVQDMQGWIVWSAHLVFISIYTKEPWHICFCFPLTRKVKILEINENANFIFRTSKRVVKEKLFIWYEILRLNVKNDVFVKYVTAAHV